MTEIKDKTLQHFLDELASKAPTPGGGSAAALMGAQSAALTGMVCNLTLGKPKYAAVEADMQQLLEQTETLRQQLIGMIKADVVAFDQLMAAYGLPKESDDQKAKRSEAIQKQLKEATLVPMACARACSKAIKFSRIAAEKGNLGVISDAGVAAMAGYAGLKSAALNAYINAGNLKDKDFADSTLQELEEILRFSDTEAENVYQIVKSKL